MLQAGSAQLLEEVDRAPFLGMRALVFVRRSSDPKKSDEQRTNSSNNFDQKRSLPIVGTRPDIPTGQRKKPGAPRGPGLIRK